ncbi:MAG: AraC family ligand binding domain-containing protein [Thermoleophilia bacterium]|nr:AraC family ligand binding domain-containing protein [Thermoleophilia bacterium]
MTDHRGAAGRAWRLARLGEIPALPPTDERSFWSSWTADPTFPDGWHSVGRHLGINAFGVNAKEADAGQELVARHAESEFAAQQELYILVRGRARFTCERQELELGPGDMLLVEPDVVRAAIALETPTAIVCVGGVPGEGYRSPDWNAG